MAETKQGRSGILEHIIGDKPSSWFAYSEENHSCQPGQGRARANNLVALKVSRGYLGLLGLQFDHWFIFLQSAGESYSKWLWGSSIPHLLSRCQGPALRSFQSSSILSQTSGGIWLITSRPKQGALHHKTFPSGSHPNSTVVRAEPPSLTGACRESCQPSPSSLTVAVLHPPPPPPRPPLWVLNHLIFHLLGTQTKAKEAQPTIKNDASQQTK